MKLKNHIVFSFSLLLALLCFYPHLQAQQLVFDTTITAQSVHIDELGNIYVQSNNSILKFNEKGQLEQQYNSRKYGQLYSFDVQNPYKILLFYKDFGKIVILDNMLSQLSVIDLQSLYFSTVGLAATSYQDGFWIYDNVRRTLIRFSSKSQIKIKTGDLGNLLNRKLNPKMMVESNDKLYLLNDSSVLVFDIFGSFLKAIPTGNTAVIQPEEKNLFYLKSDSFYSFNFNTLEVRKQALPQKNITSFSIQNHILALITPKHFYIYNLK